MSSFPLTFSGGIMIKRKFKIENKNINSVGLQLERSMIPGRFELKIQQHQQAKFEFDSLDEIVEFGKTIQELVKQEKAKE